MIIMPIAKIMSGISFKVVKMGLKWSCLVVLLLVVGCQQTGTSVKEPNLPAGKGGAVVELDKQLKINRETLLTGPVEQIRVDAATVLLFSDDPQSRKILLDALKQTGNKTASTAICLALGQTRDSKVAIPEKTDFVQPLLDILATDASGEIAKQAAEAALIFEYEQIGDSLEKIASDTLLPVSARLNAIYALKLQPNKRAILRLMDLLEDSQSQISGEAGKSLISLNIPVGMDDKSRRQIRNDFRRMSREEFLRVWEIRQLQEKQIHQLNEELQTWQQMYKAALDTIYDSKNGDVEKGGFLAKNLSSPKAAVKLWALDKILQWRTGTNPKLPVELGPVLLNLIADEDRNVRLKTANVLSLMGEINSAQKLLQQIVIEQDNEVRIELFVALGVACNYALLPSSEFKIAPEIRKQTLEIAVKYLFGDEAKNIQKAAEVLKKLLEQEGLSSAEVEGYLGLLAERYNQLVSKNADGVLRGELLNVMAGLCARSVYKAESTRIFRPLFEQALNDETNLVREAAVDGLIYVDKAKALKILRNDFVNDGSAIVRKKIISLASEVGSREDLLWLSERLGTSAESEQVWQTMLKIFERPEANAELLREWVGKLYSQNSQNKLSDDQFISFLEIAERKAVGENNSGMLKDVREKLAQFYSKRGDFERAAEYFGLLRETAQTAQERDMILAGLLNVYLKGKNWMAAEQLINHSLMEKDLEPNDVIVRSINNYLNEHSDGTDPNSILKVLTRINVPERPLWEERLNIWTKLLSQKSDPNKPKISK
jgi:HEAT repeat protein